MKFKSVSTIAAILCGCDVRNDKFFLLFYSCISPDE